MSSRAVTIGFRDTSHLQCCIGVILCASILNRDQHVPYIVRMCMRIPRPAHSQGANDWATGDESMSGGLLAQVRKRKARLYPCRCAVSIALSVRALPRLLSLIFFSFSVILTVERSNEFRSAPVPLLLSDGPRVHPSKKSSQSLTKATLSLFQPQSPPTTSTND